MLALFHAIIDRVKSLFAVSAAQELEAEMLARDAERRAELLRQAERYEDEGFHGIAQNLRLRAEELSSQRPLASVLPALEHLQVGKPETQTVPLLTAAPTASATATPIAAKKKGARS